MPTLVRQTIVLASAFCLSACGAGPDPDPALGNSGAPSTGGVPISMPDPSPTPGPDPTTNPDPTTDPDPTSDPDPTPPPSPGESDFFENKVFDDDPEEIFADDTFAGSTNDTARVMAAINRAAAEDEDGGVVILRGARNGANKRFRIDRIDTPSNIRIEVDPDVTLEMTGGTHRFLFVVGRSASLTNLNPERVRNVEITSTHETERFTIDAKTNFPIVYKGEGTKETGVNATRAIPVGFYYVENFSISNVTIVDNHTESVSIQMFPDTNYEDGAYADRSGAEPVFLDGPGGNPLPTNASGQFIDEDGNVIPDRDAIVRNDTYGRTPIKGTIENVLSLNAHTGYGAVQSYGSDWVKIHNIEAVNGIGVRLEAGNGTKNDNVNRSGPYHASSNNIEISDITVREGFTGVWLKAHSKINKNITIHNVTAIDSGTAILVDKGTMCRTCRDFIRGRYENTRVTGDVTLTRTGTADAEVGFLATLFMAESERDKVTDTNGDGRKTTADLPRNLSGRRWYLIQPTVPVLAPSQFSATDIGDQSETEGFFAIDFSEATIQGEGLLRPETFLYRTDMTQMNGTPANAIINE